MEYNNHFDPSCPPEEVPHTPLWIGCVLCPPMIEQLIVYDEDDDEIPTIEEACHELASMTKKKLSAFCQDLLTCGKFDDVKLRRHLVETAAKAAIGAQAVAAAGPTPPHHPPTPTAGAQSAANFAAAIKKRHWHQEALADADAKVVKALDLIAIAERTLGGTPHPMLRAACASLQATTLSWPAGTHLAAGAARASDFMHNMKLACSTPKAKFVTHAVNAVRDVVMLRCRGLSDDITSRSSFLAHAEQAYGRELNTIEEAQLMLSYFKDDKNLICGFKSNNGTSKKRAQALKDYMISLNSVSARSCVAASSAATSSGSACTAKEWGPEALLPHHDEVVEQGKEVGRRLPSQTKDCL